MARSLRIQYPGAYYHVMARGNRREIIFHDDDDRRFFLHTLAQACEMTGWQVHAWETGSGCNCLTKRLPASQIGPMARSLRIQYPGAYYHVMARGNRREVIFHDDDDRRFFLHTLAQACEMTGWQVHAWVLLGNHYHLFIRTPEPNLVAGMAWLQNTLTRRYNVRHRAWGRVFGDRYKAVVVEGEDPYHYQTLMDYIHLNPLRARLIRPREGQSVLDYPWSSLAGAYALPPKKRAPWLAAAEGLRAFDLPDTAVGRRRMVERLDQRALKEAMKTCGVPPLPEEADARGSHLRRGWYWGAQAFGEKLRQLAQSLIATQRKPQSRNYRGDPHLREHGQAQAEAWLKAGLKAAGLTIEDLRRLKGSDPRKLLLAERLWRRTTVSQTWLAEQLHMRSAANVSQQLRRLDRKRALSRAPRPLRHFLNNTQTPQ